MNLVVKITSAILIYAVPGAVCATEASATASGDPTHSRYVTLDRHGKIINDIGVASCVKDSDTGLLWELKTDDGGIHDKDNGYRWGGMGAEVDAHKKEAGTFDDWNSLVMGSNKEKLCGYADWHVPNIDELKTLIDTTNPELTINSHYFPLTLPMPYWSTSAYANYPEHGQTVHFGNGTSYYYNGYRGNPLQVRLVRGAISH